MVDQTINAFFEKLYDTTYAQTVLFVAKRCDNPAEISDILQEIYADVFATLISKGCNYIKNGGAFVQHLTKKKLARYYSVRSRLKDWIPLFNVNQQSDEEYEAIPIELDEMLIEQQVENKVMMSEISKILSKKPADTQKIFLLYYSLDMTIEQIAIELKLNKSTVKTKLYRTIAELRKIYGKDGM